MAVAVSTVDYHTAGEPFRIVTGGVRDLRGGTILEKRRDALENLDDVRRLLICEPRGHADMYGCFVTAPEDEGADLGVVFFHNEGYSTACGHGTIALVTWALESGVLPAPESGEAEVVVDAPSGRLPCVALCRGGRVESVRFRNVPSFVLATGLRVEDVPLDVAYGGAFYASVDVDGLGLEVSAADLPRLIALQRRLRPAIEAELDVVHPLEPELHGVYGVVFHEEAGEGRELRQRNVTVFADGEVDRSPCGSGTSARLALLHAAGRLAVGEPLRHLSILDTEFVGRVVGTTDVDGRPAVVTEVEGSAHLTGRHEFVLAPEDPLGAGFLLR
jgi:proline racemase